MKFAIKLFTVVALMGVIGLTHAADEKKERKGGKKNDPVASMMKKLESLDLSAEQKEKLTKISEEFGQKLKEAAAKVESGLTPEQKQAQATARKSAKEAGKKGKEAAAEIETALNLSDEQKQAIKNAKQGMAEAQSAFNAAVSEVLSPEQREKAGIGAKRKKKGN